MPTNYKNLGNREGSGDPNIMKLKDINRVRPLDDTVAGWRQHGIEHPSDPEQFTSMVCPGARSCPLCRKPVDADGKQRFPISRRFAANAWDYDTGTVKVLLAGPQVFDEFKAVANVGIDPAASDWTITKTGSGKNTKYEMIRHDASDFTATVITPDMLHDVVKYEQPDSTEKIFEALENFGIDYDSLSTPSYTYEQALAFVFPYTGHKGETVEYVLAHDQDFCEWLHGTKLEQGQLGDPVFLALQVAMQERGLVEPLEEALAALPEPEPAPTTASTPTVRQPAAPAAGVSPASANMVPLIGTDGAEVRVPPSAVDTLLTAGFRHPEPERTPVDANAPMQVLIGGQQVELPREQALALIASGTASEPAAQPEPPKLPLPDEVVQVQIGAVQVPMPYVEAMKLVDGGSGSFADPDVAAAHQAANDRAAATPDPSPSPAPASASTAPAATSNGATAADPEKPFACDQPGCDAAYKTQGALTNHKNRQHKAAEPQPSAVPVPSNGEVSTESRVKAKIASAPFAQDFQKLLEIFDQEAGIRNFAEMTEEQMLKIEARIDAEAAAVGQAG